MQIPGQDLKPLTQIHTFRVQEYGTHLEMSGSEQQDRGINFISQEEILEVKELLEQG